MGGGRASILTGFFTPCLVQAAGGSGEDPVWQSSALRREGLHISGPCRLNVTRTTGKGNMELQVCVVVPTRIICVHTLLRLLIKADVFHVRD